MGFETETYAGKISSEVEVRVVGLGRAKDGEAVARMFNVQCK